MKEKWEDMGMRDEEVDGEHIGLSVAWYSESFHRPTVAFIAPLLFAVYNDDDSSAAMMIFSAMTMVMARALVGGGDG